MVSQDAGEIDMGRIRYDWLKIRAEYTNATMPVSQADLCRKYGINPVTISRKATKEQWDIKRDRYQMRVQEQTTEKKAEVVATEGAKWDADCMAAAKTLRDKALAEVTDGAKVKDVAGALKIAQDMGKAALGDKADSGTLDLLVLEIKKAIG